MRGHLSLDTSWLRLFKGPLVFANAHEYNRQVMDSAVVVKLDFMIRVVSQDQSETDQDWDARRGRASDMQSVGIFAGWNLLCVVSRDIIIYLLAC